MTKKVSLFRCCVICNRLPRVGVAAGFPCFGRKVTKLDPLHCFKGYGVVKWQLNVRNLHSFIVKIQYI